MKHVATLLLLALTITSAFGRENGFTLWYTVPVTSANAADKWMEYSLPIGNGQLGASITGGTDTDEVQFNEKTLWSGKNTVGEYYGHYQNFGSLYAGMLDRDIEVVDYCRKLNLDSALCGTSFRDKRRNIRYSRQYFASFPEKCIVVRYSASGKGNINMCFRLVSGKSGVDGKTSYESGEGFFSGKLDLISYNSRFKVCVSEGKGRVSTTKDGIYVENADEVTVILAGATDFDPYSKDYTSDTYLLDKKVRQTIAKAAGKSWNKLLKRHLKDYMPIFGRMCFLLDGAVNDIPTNELIDTYNAGDAPHAKALQQLYFAYGRYLEISSSRGVDIPSNLQGIWCNSPKPAWNCDIHSNINVQMNYWPAETANLSEMHMPFLNYIINMALNHEEWKNVAKEAGQSKGWTVYTENNIMGGMGSFAHNYVIANAWYATHLWQHYRYTLDYGFLKRAFPAMWSAAEFWLERLVIAKDGSYECPNEFSPEHGPDENATAHSQQLVCELLCNTLDAAKVLGKDCFVSKDSLAVLNDRISRIDKGLATELYDGRWGEEELPKGSVILREWKYSPYSAGEPHHRHSSHLMCLYPFGRINPSSPYFDAAINSMKLRGDASTGWSMGWKINLWARAKNGNRALKVLSRALRHSTSYNVNQYAGGVYYNLYDSHAPFQIDGNFGACAGIAEMLLQSHTDTIEILPALPEAWKNGSVKGMKAVGNFTVDFSWNNGKPRFVSIKSNMGRPLYVSCKNMERAETYIDGKSVDCEKVSGQTIYVPLKKGGTLNLSLK